MKKLFLICICAMAMLLTACDHLPPIYSSEDSSEDSFESSSAAADSSDASEDSTAEDSYEPQYYDGRIGDTFSTVFFDFSVDSVSLAEDIAPSAEGMMVIDLVITVKNTFGEELPMFYNDFQLAYGDGDSDFCYSILDDTLPLNMPEAYTLKRGETATYHMYFEVPETSTEYSLAYLEIYDDGTTGDTYFVYFERQ